MDQADVKEFIQKCRQKYQPAQFNHIKSFGQFSQLPSLGQFESTCGFSSLQNMILQGQEDRLQFKTNMVIYHRILQEIKKQGFEIEIFQELQRFHLDAIKNSPLFKDRKFQIFMFGCNVIQSELQQIELIQKLRQNLEFNQTAFIMLGVFLHWVLVKIECKDKQQGAKLTVFDSMNYSLEQVFLEKHQTILSRLPKDDESFTRKIQFLKDYKNCLTILYQFFNNKLCLRKKKAQLLFQEMFVSFQSFQAQQDQAKLAFWLQTQYHPKVIQSDIKQLALYLPKLQFKKWMQLSDRGSQQPLIKRLHQVQQDIFALIPDHE